MTVGGEVAVFQVMAGEALMVSGVVVFEDGEGKAGEAVHNMHLIRGQRGAGADGIVVSKFHVRQVDVPVVLSFVDDHRQHLSHGVVDEKKKDELRRKPKASCRRRQCYVQGNMDLGIDYVLLCRCASGSAQVTHTKC